MDIAATVALEYHDEFLLRFIGSIAWIVFAFIERVSGRSRRRCRNNVARRFDIACERGSTIAG